MKKQMIFVAIPKEVEKQRGKESEIRRLKRVFCCFSASLLLCFLVLSCFSGFAHGGDPSAGDGHLVLYSFHNGDVLEIDFRKGGGYDQDALKQIDHLMRSRGDDKEMAISPQLIALLDKIQDHFGAETIEIISGYRSSGFNDYLIANGRGAASESLHTQGLAVDIHIDEVAEKDLWEYVKSLGRGGAGYYPTYNFVHVDVGPVRTWREAEPKARILIGVDQSPHKGWSVITDKNIYRQGEPVTFTVKSEMLEREALVKNFWFERFRKGQWAEHTIIEKTKGAAQLSTGETFTYTWKAPTLPFGRYRIVAFTSRNYNIPPAYSNEFFVKK